MASIIAAGTTSGTSLNLSADTSGVLQLATNGTTTAVTIDTSQNVGIGTSSPTRILDVRGTTGTFAVTSTTGTNFVLGTFGNTGGALRIGAEGSSGGSLLTGASAYSGIIGTDSAYPLSFGTNATERMRITSNGTVIIAATSSSFDTTYSALQISSTGALANYAPSGDFNMTSGLYYASGEWKYTTTGLKGSRFQVANQGIQAIAGTSASPTAGGSVTQSTILYLTYNNTLSLQGATSTSGTGIAFPATQSASSDANTLDDYEEGTFTPSFTFGGSSTGITYSASRRVGQYTKIGNVVYYYIHVEMTNKGSSTGAFQITGLPFTVIGAENYVPASVFLADMASITGNLQIRAVTGSTACDAYQVVSSTYSIITNSNFTNVSGLQVSGFYRTT